MNNDPVSQSVILDVSMQLSSGSRISLLLDSCHILCRCAMVAHQELGGAHRRSYRKQAKQREPRHS